MSTLNIPLFYRRSKTSLNYSHLPPDMALRLTLSDSNYPSIKTNFHDPKDVRPIEVQLNCFTSHLWSKISTKFSEQWRPWQLICTPITFSFGSIVYIHTSKFPSGCCPRDYHWPMKSNRASDGPTGCSRYETHKLLSLNRTLFPNWKFLKTLLGSIIY